MGVNRMMMNGTYTDDKDKIRCTLLSHRIHRRQFLYIHCTQRLYYLDTQLIVVTCCLMLLLAYNNIMYNDTNTHQQVWVIVFRDCFKMSIQVQITELRIKANSSSIRHFRILTNLSASVIIFLFQLILNHKIHTRVSSKNMWRVLCVL